VLRDLYGYGASLLKHRRTVRTLDADDEVVRGRGAGDMVTHGGEPTTSFFPDLPDRDRQKVADNQGDHDFDPLRRVLGPFPKARTLPIEALDSVLQRDRHRQRQHCGRVDPTLIADRSLSSGSGGIAIIARRHSPS